jgi:hypothetical protein
MRTVTLSLLLFLYYYSSGQAKVNGLNIKSISHRFEDIGRVDTFLINYPLVSLANKNTANQINKKIRHLIFEEIDSIKTFSLQKLSDQYVEEGLTDLNYEVVFNHKNFLSIKIYLVWLGAYSAEWTRYMNFDLANGRFIEMSSVIKKELMPAFRKKLLLEKRKKLDDYLPELKELSPKNFDWGKERMEDCKKSIQLDEFILNDEFIEVFDDCRFPNAIKNLSPLYELKYSLKDLRYFLRPEFLARMH